MHFPLIGSVAHPVSTRELLSRLEQLYNELSSMDQDSSEVKSLNKVKDQLVDHKLLRHSNHGVQSYVACCLSDILRLYAPDAPYNATQLSDIFKLFFRQLKHLAQTDSGFYHLHVYLITRMVEVKAAVLLTDLPDASKLTQNLFGLVYSLVDHKLDAEIGTLLLELLTEVIGESSKLPEKVMKLILNRFLQHKKMRQNSKGSSFGTIPSFTFTVQLCKLNSDRMARLVTLFFSEMVFEVARYAKVIEDDDTSNEDEVLGDFMQLTKIHLIIVELWRYVPEILASLLGLLDNEFEADDQRIRVLATQTVGEMLSYANSSLNFIREHPESYSAWIKKPLDRSTLVRIAWIRATTGIIEARTDIASDLRDGLLKTLLDSDERVRLVTVTEFARLDSAIFLQRAVTDTSMDTLKQLMREKHPEIRNAAISLLSVTFNNVFGKPLNSLVDFVPDEIMKLVYINDRDVNAQVDLSLFGKIFPLDEADSIVRVNRLLTVLQNLSEKGKSAFLAIVKRQFQLSTTFSRLIQTAEEDNLNDDKLVKASDWLAAEFPENYNASESICSFFRSQDRRMFRLIRLALSFTTEYATLQDTIEEIQSKQSSPVIHLLLLRSCNFLYNKSNISEILQIGRSTSSNLQCTAIDVLDSISTLAPSVLKANINQLTEECISGRVSSPSTLITINNFIKKFPQLITELSFFDSLVHLAIGGTPEEAKYSVRILANSRASLKESYLQDVLDGCWPVDEASALLNTHLSALVELFMVDMILMEPETKELSNFLATRVLLKNMGGVDDDIMCSSKLFALRIFTNWLRAVQHDSESDLGAVSDPIFKLLKSIIFNGGEIVSQNDPTYPTPRPIKEKLRLEAGIRLLKLAQCAAYDSKMDQQTVSDLIFLIQDEDEQVRVRFVRKLVKRLTANTIPGRFVPLVFFIAHEPNKELKEETSTWIRASYSRQLKHSPNSLLFETSYVRLLHMISHHQEVCELYTEYTNAEGDAADNFFASLTAFCLDYIVFCLQLIANQDNISLLFYLTQRMKQYKNIEAESSSEKLYFMSDLAQLVIKRIAENRLWNISTWPGKFALPSDLYTKNRDKESLKDIVATSYIPDKYFKKAVELVRVKCRHLSSTKRPLAISSAARKTRRILEEKNLVSKQAVWQNGPKPLPSEHPTRKSAISRRTVDYEENE
ncbi:hypothetical protein FOA43_001043 [Brettanomyces nanus]|uniref:Sister chromatid cohesion protein PDS5 n=1 Tax=Eeniella nana TaxID=13502 RepID=A0A875RNH7_EENNA|nr:uncharacterized protein FOA43_001043 [Brettanomyces nanus]QPG73730.1 hypothetical protein FOA43_001043 [Brettanomyces nanus]